MTKIFCDKCGASITGDRERNIEYDVGSYGALLTKAIKVGDDEDIEVYPASYVADLCDDCQKALNDLVKVFMGQTEEKTVEG